MTNETCLSQRGGRVRQVNTQKMAKIEGMGGSNTKGMGLRQSWGLKARCVESPTEKAEVRL